MPVGLQRIHHCDHLHFITFSCDQRKPYLDASDAKQIFLHSLEQTRRDYSLRVLGYVLMPEHVHLLLSEPRNRPLGHALQALKVSVAQQCMPRPFWLRRYYDFNVYTTKKRIEKLKYMHRNPVNRGLVIEPEHWPWSSYRYYATGQQATVQIEDKQPIETPETQQN